MILVTHITMVTPVIERVIEMVTEVVVGYAAMAIAAELYLNLVGTEAVLTVIATVYTICVPMEISVIAFEEKPVKQSIPEL